MAELTLRNLPDDLHRALSRRAQRHGRSPEAEIHAILAKALSEPLPIGTALARFWHEHGDGDLALEARGEAPRDVNFE
ncbi:MAG: Arc family DNA-binding protein [Cardiobacteriaceae bacterium]|nr:Arc family DNA-binding protein [Cardiobacteriaceae bacterium]